MKSCISIVLDVEGLGDSRVERGRFLSEKNEGTIRTSDNKEGREDDEQGAVQCYIRWPRS